MGSSTTVIGGEYLVLGKIGEGSFGEVFRATHIATGIDYAIKREPANIPHPQLEHEAKMYRQLAGGAGIANMHWFGKEGMYNAMVIDLLGPNLKQVRRENEKFPLSFVIEMGIQMAKYIHKKGIVYRDVKPENFLLDADIVLPDAPLAGKANTPPTYPDQILSFFNDTRQRQQSIGSDSSISPHSPIKANYGKPMLSIVDFGLATYYRDPSGKHIPNKGCTKHKVGTARYASINIHCGREHTRRDDVESIGYLLLEFLIGTLPWSGISARNSRQGWAKMREIKEDIELDELCEGLPKGFMTYIGYTRSLKFDEEPDYEYLRATLRSSAGRGVEAQTVRCHREPSQARSFEQNSGIGGVPIQRSNDPFKTKERSKPDNPLKDWRTRSQYSPPHKEGSKDQRYSPNLLWTTTPPDVAPKDGPSSLESNDFRKEMKDKIEWDIIPDPYPDGDTDKSSFYGEDNHESQIKNRKSSWGEDDPNSRWGHEDEDSLPVQIGSFQEEHDNKALNGYNKVSIQNFGRQFAPQDARFYLDEPPVGLTPRLGNGSGFIQTNPSLPISAKGNRQQSHHNQHAKTAPIHSSVHPLSRDSADPSSLPPPPLSPKSLSSSLSVRDGAHEELGIERLQISANRANTTDLDQTISKGRGRKYSNPYERVGAGAAGGSSFENLPLDNSRNHQNGNGKWADHLASTYPSSQNGKGRSGGEHWQYDNRNGQQQQSRTGRRNNQQQHYGASSQEFNASLSSSSQGPFESQARQISVPAARTQQQQQYGGLAAQSPKQHQGFHHYYHQNHYGQSPQGTQKEYSQGGHGQSRSVGPTGFNEHRRQSRSRKCSNSSLSGLVDHWGGNNKVGNGNGNGSRLKPKS
ncbi:serine/threonine protein kinase [Entomortierella lignicola]|nr:serine/threonine protein kinase [Entomortierella lignicola]